MKKRIFGAAILGAAAVVALASCGNKEVDSWDDWDDVDTGSASGAGKITPAAADAGYTEKSDGSTIVIGCWNDEAKGFFNKYLTKEGKAAGASADGYKDFDATAKEGLHYVDAAGTELAVKFVQVTNEGGAYQQAIDNYLAAQKGTVAEDARIDMFFAEADYILKYTDSEATNNIANIGVTATDMAQCYDYTVAAAADSNSKVKGVSFQCCPSGMVYRRDIAQAVLGVSEPADVQAKVDTWEKWEAVAAQMKAAGYLMTGSYADSYRVFSNNSSTPWVTGTTLTLPKAIKRWMRQAKDFVNNGYTLTAGVWDGEKNAEFTATGKAFCTFGPAWYFNYCMGTAMGEKNEDGTFTDATKDTNTYGKWAVCKGPQAHFWGGTWALAAANGNNDKQVAEILKALVSKDFSLKLLQNEMQYTNNKEANAEFAAARTAANEGNGFLNGQNDTAMWNDMAGSIVWANATNYDQLCNEGIQTSFVKYLKKTEGFGTKEKALNDFYAYITEQYPTLTVA